MVLKETLLVSLAGIGAGIAMAFALGGFLRSLLFGVTTHDPVTVAICPTLLLIAALLAAAVPGLRASQTDPAVTLREEWSGAARLRKRETLRHTITSGATCNL